MKSNQIKLYKQIYPSPQKKQEQVPCHCLYWTDPKKQSPNKPFVPRRKSSSSKEFVQWSVQARQFRICTLDPVAMDGVAVNEKT